MSKNDKTPPIIQEIRHVKFSHIETIFRCPGCNAKISPGCRRCPCCGQEVQWRDVIRERKKLSDDGPALTELDFVLFECRDDSMKHIYLARLYQRICVFAREFPKEADRWRRMIETIKQAQTELVKQASASTKRRKQA